MAVVGRMDESHLGTIEDEKEDEDEGERTRYSVRRRKTSTNLCCVLWNAIPSLTQRVTG
jgi:hypothetical protein